MAAAPVGSSERDGDNPEVREHQVEEEDVARVQAEEKGQGEECGREDSLRNVLVSHPLIKRENVEHMLLTITSS